MLGNGEAMGDEVDGAARSVRLTGARRAWRERLLAPARRQGSRMSQLPFFERSIRNRAWAGLRALMPATGTKSP